MSKRSRRRSNRKKNKERQELKQRDEGAEAREDESTLVHEITPRSFFTKHMVEISLFTVIVIGYFFYVSGEPIKSKREKIRETVSALIVNRSYDWSIRYPGGFKIIALTDKEVVQTAYDTLPEELEVNWKQLVVERIEADPLADTPELVKVELLNFNYVPANIVGMSVATTISRYTGAMARITRLGKYDFILEVIEDSDTNLYCLFGLLER